MEFPLLTLLAYLDDVLDRDQQKALERELARSEEASQLLQRVQDVMRRFRLGSALDQRDGLDANTVAEYLDHELPRERVPDVQRQCYQSESQLAEVAACHQILSMVLGEPASVEPRLRRRIYDLESPRDAQGSADQPRESQVSGDVPHMAGEPVVPGSTVARTLGPPAGDDVGAVEAHASEGDLQSQAVCLQDLMNESEPHAAPASRRPGVQRVVLAAVFVLAGTLSGALAIDALSPWRAAPPRDEVAVAPDDSGSGQGPSIDHRADQTDLVSVGQASDSPLGVATLSGTETPGPLHSIEAPGLPIAEPRLPSSPARAADRGGDAESPVMPNADSRRSRHGAPPSDSMTWSPPKPLPGNPTSEEFPELRPPPLDVSDTATPSDQQAGGTDMLGGTPTMSAAEIFQFPPTLVPEGNVAAPSSWVDSALLLNAPQEDQPRADGEVTTHWEGPASRGGGQSLSVRVVSGEAPASEVEIGFPESAVREPDRLRPFVSNPRWTSASRGPSPLASRLEEQGAR